MGYERHEALVAPARAGAALWRTALGAVLSLLIYIVLLLQLVALLRAVLPGETARTFVAAFTTGESPEGTLLLLATFVFMAAGPLALARPLHFRSPASLFGPARAAWRDFLAVFRVLAALSAVLWLLVPGGLDLRPGLPSGTWAMLLPLTVLGILVQSSVEELVFRGYLQSQLAARFASPAVWLAIPSALFAWGHHAPDVAGENAALLTFAAFAFGLAAADLTARSGTLGPAIAFHLVNNLVALALAAAPGSYSGLALFLYPFGPDDPAMRPLLMIDIAAIGVAWLAARVALRL